jgi:hypothetical protein
MSGDRAAVHEAIEGATTVFTDTAQAASPVGDYAGMRAQSAANSSVIVGFIKKSFMHAGILIAQTAGDALCRGAV